MVCLGIEPGAAGWKARTNPLSYGGTPENIVIVCLQIPNYIKATETLKTSYSKSCFKRLCLQSCQILFFRLTSRLAVGN